LEDSVLVHLKVIFGESRNQIASAVLHGRVQDHHVNTNVNGVSVTLSALCRRVFLRPGKTWDNNEKDKPGQGQKSFCGGGPLPAGHRLAGEFRGPHKLHLPQKGKP
jgi:hypothetical protein